MVASIEEITRKVRGDRCGEDTWQRGYAKEHEASLMKPFRLVGYPAPAGFADGILGLATVCLLAIATGRAFQIGQRPDLPNFALMFAAPHINWTRPVDEPWLIAPLEYKSNVTYNESVLSTKKYLAINAMGEDRMLNKMLKSGLWFSKIDKRYENVLIAINKGKTAAMFDSRSLQRLLRGMGLTPEIAFGCIVDFLFEPKPFIFTSFKMEIDRLERGKTLKIGIQIRTGDASLKNQDTPISLDEYKNFFVCAEQIEQFVMRQQQERQQRRISVGDDTSTINNSNHYESVVWFLISDSVPLRRLARRKYGAKVVTNTDVPIEHTYSKEAGPCRADLSHQMQKEHHHHHHTSTLAACAVSKAGARAAAAEWWLFGVCDYHVISRYSGYGKTAAFRSLRNNSIYSISNGHKGKMHCGGPSAHTPFKQLMNDWSQL